MTRDPQLLTATALSLAVAWAMVFSGVKKHALELKRRKRICPSCGRDISGPVCREH